MIYAYQSHEVTLTQLRKVLWIVTATVLWVGQLAAQTRSFVSFDAPDAGRTRSEGTTPRVMNQNGLIAGVYIDTGEKPHCFVRLTNGQITEFDVFFPSIPQVLAINVHGQIVGGAQELAQGNVEHGFLRSLNGVVVDIFVPGSISTTAQAINDSGEVAGYYIDKMNAFHGFFRDAAGHSILFDAPGAGVNPNQGTTATSINAAGEIAGYYSDVNSVLHGFVRDPSGTFTSFDAPGAGIESGEGTLALALTDAGEIMGPFINELGVAFPFLRDPSGNFTTWNVEGSMSTSASAINQQGNVVGIWEDSSFLSEGYLRNVAGTITTFSAPVPNSGTTPVAINDKGRIAGYYIDLRSVSHGFVR